MNAIVRGIPVSQDSLDTPSDMTERALLALVFDISMLDKSVERIKVQVFALAKRHGIEPVDGVDVD